MATVGEIALTLNDYRKRQGVGGKIDEIIEVLAASNPILDDMTWMEGNLTTGNKTTLRNSIPKPDVRYINKGVSYTKSSTDQIVDTSCILQSRSKVDVELLALAPDKEAFRRSEDVAHIEGFGQAVADMVIYGNTDNDPDTFNGLDVRHRILSNTSDPTKPGYTTLDAGGTGGSLTSAYLVEWGSRTCTGIYPRGASAGLDHKDLGVQTVQDRDGNDYEAEVSVFTWKVGLAVRDYRSVGAVRNIDMTTFASGTASAKQAIMSGIVKAQERLRHPDKAVMYVSNDLYTAFKLYLMDKNNSYVQTERLENGIIAVRFNGMRVVKLDAIKNNEAQVV
jgi:hypothetical protein